jgi:hypothetical protein
MRAGLLIMLLIGFGCAGLEAPQPAVLPNPIGIPVLPAGCLLKGIALSSGDFSLSR